MSHDRPRDRLGRPLPPGSPDALAGAADPATLESVEQAVEAAAALFDDERFFEAHEVLEHVWKRSGLPDAERELWGALTQIAVGCCHVQRQNPDGAVALLERGARRLAAYASPVRGIDAARMAEDARELAGELRGGGIASARFRPWRRAPG